MGCVSVAEEKSRSSLLRKRRRVLGAAGESELRTRIECSLRDPANLQIRGPADERLVFFSEEIIFEHVRHKHDELLIAVTDQLRLRVQALGPGFFDDFSPSVRLAFVQGVDFFELDLLPDESLESGLGFVGVVVAMIVVIVTMAPMVVMFVMRHSYLNIS